MMDMMGYPLIESTLFFLMIRYFNRHSKPFFFCFARPSAFKRDVLFGSCFKIINLKALKK